MCQMRCHPVFGTASFRVNRLIRERSLSSDRKRPTMLIAVNGGSVVSVEPYGKNRMYFFRMVSIH